ncbi:glycosyltransferase involved in cell wall biosynthesis [Roseimicrobium gellanilyticum]|uniref:Glycosyltransferase involved in cell wall biosynthesis n=1 Tax=Roseimicrobium gellanilyticum TaxID=748857 RepID=A0A366HDS8_9BACT|nr:glycosyltransferase family 4 protein [Roseimicrobium gellanilyticum]RBP39774.1 glycosyltransferase involved in cell wall biosynthesis [Roseimicrobium gellanilyticum]
MPRPRLAYLYSRYPVVSQTFCDSEMLALEGMGFDLEVFSLNPPPDSFRHERLDRLRAEIHYPAPEEARNAQVKQPEFETQLGALIKDHDQRYGKSFKSRTRARNAWHFAPRLRALGVKHVHVHFANRATHSALFLKKLGFTFSFTAHAQDFMVDLGSDDLLREMVREAEFVVAVSDFSRSLLCQTCPGNEAKILRIYNGIELDDFPVAQPAASGSSLRLVSVGRLIEFKGFQHLIPSMTLLKQRGVNAELHIIGEGPARTELEGLITDAGLQQEVKLLGVRSQEQIKRELAEAHAFVLPSIVDSKGASDILPTVITEAMACHLPVVSTTVAGIPEMVRHGETGLLVEPKDEAGMAEALMQLAAQPELRVRMGAAGRKHADMLFALSVTAGALGENFNKVAQSSSQRVEAPIVYVMDDADAEASALHSIANEERLRIIAGGIAGAAAELSPALLNKLEWIPDAVVLESLWLRRTAWRHQIEKLRTALGDALDGEEFYRQARRAVWYAESLPKRGAKVVHAYRSDAVVCVWLVKKLTGLRTTAAIEDAPSLSRAALAKLILDFDLVSVSDEKLCAALPRGVEDTLKLQKPPTHRKLNLGPLKLKVRNTAPVEDRSVMERAWLEKLISLSQKPLHA